MQLSFWYGNKNLKQFLFLYYVFRLLEPNYSMRAQKFWSAWKNARANLIALHSAFIEAFIFFQFLITWNQNEVSVQKEQPIWPTQTFKAVWLLAEDVLFLRFLKKNLYTWFGRGFLFYLKTGF